MWHQITKYEISQEIKAWKGRRVIVTNLVSFSSTETLRAEFVLPHTEGTQGWPPPWSSASHTPRGSARGHSAKPSERVHWCEIPARGNLCPWKGGAGCAAAVTGAEEQRGLFWFHTGKDADLMHLEESEEFAVVAEWSLCKVFGCHR